MENQMQTDRNNHGDSRLVQTLTRQFVEQLTLLHGQANVALKVNAQREIDAVLEQMVYLTRNLVALAHVLGAASWQGSLALVAKEDA